MVVRLSRVKGLEGRRNDVLFSPCVRRVQAPPALVFWGGDVQDYPEIMQAHRDNRAYIKWNLENTARILSQNFPTYHIVVVRPSRIKYKSFSCYDNFVPSNNPGVPEHTPTHSALLHLQKLLQEVSNQVKKIPEQELLAGLEAAANDADELNTPPKEESSSNGAANPAPETLEPTNRLWWRADLALHESKLSLVGFSKGCVVLNQLLYEFHYTHTLTPADTQATRFISCITAMYWLDGGHAGGRNTWLSSRCLLETLVRLNVEIFVHVSPYQVQDEARPWIGREERAFTAMLRKLGANVHRYLHSDSAPVTLLTHFSVLSNFRSRQDSGPPSAPQDSDTDDSTK
ncbi:mitochondrial protein C2orf69 homolog [Leguminivora glycinivorella]|uniref:mitochondrial protein C2orf69 homolog n=1 Tax=Leguminivora glycinivorella TaxID=1035111 RepID=UPI00200E8A43|nr:mitochondrial protein C2orf69 homolog [Leguminivora glycinivorella]XP_048000852.1 mitochondrial protein C2orf69 homolog [Leguminivora glycinivorella]